MNRPKMNSLEVMLRFELRVKLEIKGWSGLNKDDNRFCQLSDSELKKSIH